MSQTSSLLFLTDPEYSGRFASFASIENVSFIKDVVPGDQLRLEMEVKVRILLSPCKDALVEGKMVCEGALSFSLAAKPTKPQIHPTASVHASAIIGKMYRLDLTLKLVKMWLLEIVQSSNLILQSKNGLKLVKTVIFILGL